MPADVSVRDVPIMKAKRGYSLVEVLIAIAITSIVLLTVVTLFYMGRRNVYSGREMTYAVSVGTRALEDVSQMTLSDVISNFGIANNQAMPGATVNGVTYANSYEMDTGSAGVAANPNPPPAILTNWKSMCTNMANPTVGVIFTPRAWTDANNKSSTATFMRMRIFVQWDEAKNRRRIAFFDTTKINRQQ
jgi:prepilin-type N-terminal cleavage/methylation domain-containing protein